MSPVSAPRSRASRAALGGAVALGVVLALEGLLRVLGVAMAPPGIDLERRPDGVLVVRVEAPASAVSGEAAFSARKPDGVFRVAFVGASTTKGVPYAHVSSYPLFTVARMAPQLVPMTFECVNLGAPTEPLRTSLQLARIALDAGADMLVLEAGHNEFLENNRAAQAAAFAQVARALEGSRLWRALERALRPPADATAARKNGALGAPHDVPVLLGEEALAFRTKVEERFAADFDTLLSEAADHAVPVVVVLPPTDVADFIPEQAFAPGVLPGDDAETNAVTVFRRAQEARAKGMHGEAAALFARARDLDPLPGGLTPRLVEVMRAHATARGAIVADVYGAFIERAADGLVGLPLLVDHCHPSLAGQYAMAGVVVDAMRAGKVIGRSLRTDVVAWDAGKDPAFESLLATLHIDTRYLACAEADAGLADFAYALVSHDPRFYAGRCAQRLERGLATLPEPASGRVALALAYALLADPRAKPLLDATIRGDGEPARAFLQILVDSSPRARQALAAAGVRLGDLGVREPVFAAPRG